MFAQKSGVYAFRPRPARSHSRPHQADRTATRPPTIEAYAARRSYAFDIAEEAYWQHRICADAYMLFRLLTRLCKERTYCWPGLDYLAERLQTSIGTIKRRLDVLERADLIERKQRPGGLTSYTYVLPLQQYDAAQHAVSDAPPMHDAEPWSSVPPAAAEIQTIHAEQEGHRAADLPVEVEGQASPLFFVPEQEINAAPADRSKLIRQTIKSQNRFSGGGRDTASNAPAADATETSRTLAQAGILSPLVLDELKHTPLPQVEACLRFARRQRNIVDPAAFAVSLLRLGFGQKLVDRMQAASDKLHAAHGEYARYHCAHGRIRGTGCPDCEQASKAGMLNGTAPQQASAGPSLEAVGASTADDLLRIWSAVLDALQPQVSPVDFETWLRPTALAELAGNTAVIATPHVFARERVAVTYAPLLAAALQAVVGQPVQIEVVISAC
ncbi:MAG TPA: DnaA N-terminal domain-containing protein [Herpetosiphonaceae bacterium]